MLAIALPVQAAADATYYVATNGSDASGNGSTNQPWGSISYALQKVPDGSLILVRPGTYTGEVRLRGNFPRGVTVRSEVPYHARLRYKGQAVIANGDVSGIVLEGFDIAHSGPGAGPLVIHLSGSKKLGTLRNITLRNNILHDSFNSDVLKIDGSAQNVLVEGNVFYNQSGSDEHIDVNSARDVIIRGNIFFNDFAGSGRPNNNDTSSFIVIKDSSGNNDELIGSHNILVSGNVFLNWQGLGSSTFIMIGEDGHPFFEAQDVMVENNLMLGNSPHEMRASLAVYGSRNITFRNNTVSGDLPAYAYAMLLSKAVSNPSNENVRFMNNIWADQTGTMGARSGQNNNDFSDTDPNRTTSFSIDHNVYWNNGKTIPSDSKDKVNYTNDANRVVGDPRLPLPVVAALPRWNETIGKFGDGSSTIAEAFVRLVKTYGAIPANSAAVKAADPSTAPAYDILGQARGNSPDAGAYQSIPQVILGGRPGNGFVSLHWRFDGTLPADATWNISYTKPGGGGVNVASGLPISTRAYHIDGLPNYVRYSFTVSAIAAGGNTLYTSTTQSMATDIFVFLPSARRP